MPAIEYSITVRTGSTFELPVACTVQDPATGRLTVRNLAGWTGAMQVRRTADADEVLADAEVDIDIDTGIVTATIDDVVTADYTWRVGVYDLIITDGIRTDPLACGTAECVQGVTRA